MRIVEIAATATIWAMFSCFLLFPRLGLPAVFHRTAMTLLTAELLALMVWSYGRDAGGPAVDTASSAAAIDIPLLSVALVVLAVLFGARVIYFRRNEDSRHGFPRQGRLRDRGRTG
jgi:hypothetical protein